MAIATPIVISRGIVANAVNKPTIKSKPHTISTTPTKGATYCGQGIPIFAKRPAPIADGKRNYLYTFREEDPTHEDADEQDAQRVTRLRFLWKHRHGNPRSQLGSVTARHVHLEKVNDRRKSQQ